MQFIISGLHHFNGQLLTSKRYLWQKLNPKGGWADSVQEPNSVPEEAIIYNRAVKYLAFVFGCENEQTKLLNTGDYKFSIPNHIKIKYNIRFRDQL